MGMRVYIKISDNGVTIVNFVTSKNKLLRVQCSHTETIISTTVPALMGRLTHNQTDHILIDRRWHLSILGVQSFRGADCDTDHFLVLVKVRKRLTVSKQAAQNLHGENLTTGR
jgi:hypothetical protein